MSTGAIDAWALRAIVIAICGALAALVWWFGSGDDGGA
jgi:hypothetical protein